MLGRLKSFVTPSITPSSSRPSSPPPPTDGARKGSTSPPSSSSAAKSLPLPTEAQLDALRAQEIPLSDCTGCAGEGDGEWEGPDLPRKFEVDLTSEMLGSSKPMHRLALISTSKHDWPHDICDDTSSLAFHLSSVHQRKNPLPDLLGKLSLNGKKAGEEEGGKEAVQVEGIYESAKESKLTVLASSVEVPHDEGVTTALVFPDFKFITSIPISKTGATALYDQALSPAPSPPLLASSPPQPELGSWTLPYKAVIMLCSHKSRDKRCSIAAPLLESVLSQTLAMHGHTVDTTGASLEPEMLHAHTGTEGVRAATGGSKEVGIFKISHLGGHRYSGVMIIALPTGAMLYYGRVRPRDCVAIVEETILGGKVLPQHLRSGGNLGGRKEGKTLLDW